MLPHWFRVLLVAEVLGVVAVVVLGAHLLVQGAHATGDALAWSRPAHPSPSARASGAPSLPALVAPARNGASSRPLPFGAALLTPKLLIRLNQDARATAVDEYTLLVQLESLARDEITRLLNGIHVPPADNAGG
jgi:hypothetical protein